MQQPLCALCHQARPLLKSHFFPAGLYRLLQTPGDKNTHPVLTSRELAKQNIPKTRRLNSSLRPSVSYSLS
jgi:hypothetical protein